MNRRERRAAAKESAAAGNDTPALFAEAVRCQQHQRLEDAARAYKRLLKRAPDHAEALNNLGCVLQAQGKPREASACFARSLALVPQLFNDFAPIAATLTALLPPLGAAMRRADAAWPARLPFDRLLAGSGLAAIADDPLLVTILQSTPVRDVALERALTDLRAALLEVAAGGGPADDLTLAFCCALARQCFVNEYVFASTPEENARVDALVRKLPDTAPAELAALAMYGPLHALPQGQSLAERRWPHPVDEVVTQQVREPMEERALRAAIPRLTAIDDDVSLRVRQQYEENPYPRWVYAAGNVEPLALDDYLRNAMPGAAFDALAAHDAPEVLVAGCGTGSLPIELARKLAGARVLAIDLSLASLAYAKRKTPADIVSRLDYAQADILKLGDLGRSFDVIDASGVLHHMAEPAAGLRVLLQLLRPGGVMHLGLYSALARRDVTAARAYVAEKNYQSTAEDIRRARQDILTTHLRDIGRVGDFFTTSECRDLLFHVQEHQMSIPQIKALLADTGLRFIGFAFDPMRARQYAAMFAQAGRSTADLDAWHDFETCNPDTFLGMYQFWVQKPPA
jgi:2-polyprenyl-3-methyl-5-hydroxy-6-metoxy-1,4-benzoquinol methylase